MFANRSFFATMALTFALVLVGAACAESPSDDVPEVGQAATGDLAAEEPTVAEEDHATEEAHEEEDNHATEEAHEEEDDHATEEGRIVEVTMSEFAFDPLSVEVTAGETVTFVVTNIGVVEHEFRLSNEHRIEEHLASGHAGHTEEGGHHSDADMVLLLAAGESGEMTVTFPEDATVFTHTACLIPGHYEAGMGGEVTYAA